MSDRNTAVIKKIKGLLAIANDNQNDEESQSAFMMAQKLMLKYDISMGEVDTENDDKAEIKDGRVTAYKKVYWWESRLAGIISRNFKVKFYYSNKVLPGESRTKRSIIFFGYEKDVALAKEMYILAYDVLTFYTKRFVEENALDIQIGLRKLKADLKNSYMRGFLDGLARKFKDQLEEMSQEFGLMVITPHAVQQAYDEKFEGVKSLSVNIPDIREVAAYMNGYEEGNTVDYTKSTIDDDILV